MSLRIKCPKCQIISDIPNDFQGKKAHCRQCHVVFQIPTFPASMITDLPTSYPQPKTKTKKTAPSKPLSATRPTTLLPRKQPSSVMSKIGAALVGSLLVGIGMVIGSIGTIIWTQANSTIGQNVVQNNPAALPVPLPSKFPEPIVTPIPDAKQDGAAFKEDSNTPIAQAGLKKIEAPAEQIAPVEPTPKQVAMPAEPPPEKLNAPTVPLAKVPTNKADARALKLFEEIDRHALSAAPAMSNPYRPFRNTLSLRRSPIAKKLRALPVDNGSNRLRRGTLFQWQADWRCVGRDDAEKSAERL